MTDNTSQFQLTIPSRMMVSALRRIENRLRTHSASYVGYEDLPDGYALTKAQADAVSHLLRLRGIVCADNGRLLAVLTTATDVSWQENLIWLAMAGRREGAELRLARPIGRWRLWWWRERLVLSLMLDLRFSFEQASHLIANVHPYQAALRVEHV